MTQSDVSIKFSYPDFDLEVDFPLPTRGISGLFGSSGSGKTTLIRCLAGLERPVHAHISVGGTLWQSDDIFLPPQKRRLGMVFQDVRLFNHLDVMRNLLFGYKRTAPEDRKIKIDDVLEILDLEPLLSKRPEKLSGGEAQRVAIGRALLTSPSLLLMDEPLAALGDQHKKDILPYLKKLPREFGIPLLYVSHNFEEMASLAPHIICLKKGRIQAQGDWQTVVRQMPDIMDRWAPDNIITGEISSSGCFKLADGQEISISTTIPSGKIIINARDISLLKNPPTHHGGVALLKGKISETTPISDGKDIVKIILADQELHAILTARDNNANWICAGKDVYMMINGIKTDIK